MKDDYGIPFGYTPDTDTFPSYKDNRHLVTFGPTRSGKGATVIVQALLMVPHSVVCIDPKGQLAAITARRRRELGQAVHLLNPFNELGLGSSRFNPLAHLRIDQPNLVADVRSLAEALIIREEKDSHFSDSALDLVTALMLYLVATKGGNATLGDMRALLTLPEEMFLDTIKAMVMMREYPFIAQPAGRFHDVGREMKSVISTAITQTFFLDDPNIARVLGGSDFNMLQLKQKATTVFLILPGRYMEAYSRFLRLLVTSAIDQLTARPGGRRTLFLLDEFATLKNLGAVATAFGFAAGYNVQIWPFLQDLPQLKTIYGDRWESFIANAGMLQFFTPSDMTTAEYLERRGGRHTDVRRSQSQAEISKEMASRGFSGVTTSLAEDRVPLLPPELTMKMDGHAQLVFFAGVHGAAIKHRFEYYRLRRLQGLYDPDPFH